MRNKYISNEDKKAIEAYGRWLDEKAKKGKIIRKEKKKKKTLYTLSDILYK